MNPPYRSARTSLFSLPNELLLLIRDSLGPSDLLGHTCYYLLHARTRACYVAYDDKPQFWKSLLFENGLSLSSYDSHTSDIAWRMAAIKYVKHAWVCKHPACGIQRLEQNKVSLQEARQSWSAEHWNGHSPFDTLLPFNSPTHIKQNPLFLSIGFNNAFPPSYLPVELRSDIIGACAFLRETPEDDEGWLPTDFIGIHPIASRSFATFPPVNSFSINEDILDYDLLPIVTNHDGVTVFDALVGLSEILGIEMSEADIRDLDGSFSWPTYQHDDWESESDPGPFPDKWPLSHTVQLARRFGNLFQLAQWEGFCFDDFTSKAVGYIDFKSKPLPDNAWSHFVKCTYPKTDFAAANAFNGFQYL